MADKPTIHVDIVSAEGEIFSGEAAMLYAAGTEGDLGIAPRHAPKKITVLADTAIRAADIDEAAALEAKQRAEEALKDKSGHITEAEALAELARAAAMLKMAEKLRKLRG
jgi:F-type H+-transporting ATPase subunit epsilon